MSTPNPAQADIDADVAQLTADFTAFAGIFTDLQNLVAEANGNGNPVSTAALDALVAQGASVLQNYQGLVTPVDPTPDPAPESTKGSGSSAEAIGATSKESSHKKSDDK